MLNRQAQRTEVTQLPPTTGIQDPIVRGFLDALSTAWATRSGFIDKDHPDGFVTRGEVGNLANQAVLDVFSGGVIGGAQAGANNFASSAHAAQINDAIDNLSDSIRKSILNQLLEEDILNVSGITQVVTTAGADVSAEVVVRASADTALARAINNIWASIGGASAVIEDGGLAAAGSSVATATKWDQVTAAVTDPGTGLVNAGSIKQELNTYASANDGTLNAIYSVRAQISTGGQTIVGGFGLAATAGAGSAAGPTIDFGVRADKFFIAATSSTGNAATQLAGPQAVPFIVLTTTETVNGVSYPPGVYIKRAVIGDATIATAQIADLSVTTGKIADLSVDTLKIAGNAVTIPIGGTATSAVTLTGSNQTLITLSSMSPGAGVPVLLVMSVAATATYSVGSPGPLSAVFEIKRGATVVHSWPVDFPGTSSTGTNFFNVASNFIETPGATATYTLEARVTSGTGSAVVNARTLSAIALKK